MSGNLHNRLKKIEAHPGLAGKERICKIFTRMRPGEKSEAERQFFREHQSDLSNYKILIITWHDPNAKGV